MNRLSMFLRVLVIVGVAEFLVMRLLAFTGLPEGVWWGVLDAALLVALSAPFLYTDRKRAEAEKLQLIAAIEQATDAIVITNLEGQIQ